MKRPTPSKADVDDFFKENAKRLEQIQKILDAPTLTFKTSPKVIDCLHKLLATGLYGPNVSSVAERLLCEKIRDLTAAGELL